MPIRFPVGACRGSCRTPTTKSCGSTASAPPGTTLQPVRYSAADELTATNSLPGGFTPGGWTGRVLMGLSGDELDPISGVTGGAWKPVPGVENNTVRVPKAGPPAFFRLKQE